MESIQKGHPPPFGERQERLAPIIFRAIKVEKSSPQENIIFRTKNTAKSQPALGEKISEKICGKMFWGKRKAPNLVERGRRTLKYERIKFGAKIVELFVIARG